MHDELLMTASVRLLQKVLRASPSPGHGPHRHAGVLSKYRGALPDIRLRETDINTIRSGQAIRCRPAAHGRGGDVIVYRVEAPESLVFSVITDFTCYPRTVPGMQACHVYRRDAGDTRVRFKRTLMGKEQHYFVRYATDARRGQITWALDYDYESDVDDAVGYWRLLGVSLSPAVTQVECVETFGQRSRVPGARGELLHTSAAAMRWVQQEALQRKALVHVPRRPVRRMDEVSQERSTPQRRWRAVV